MCMYKKQVVSLNTTKSTDVCKVIFFLLCLFDDTPLSIKANICLIHI